MKKGILVLSALCFLSCSNIVALTKVVEGSVKTPSINQKHQENSQEFADTYYSQKAKKKYPQHYFLFSQLLRHNELHNVTYSKFNNQDLHNEKTLSDHKIAFDYAVEYHYRPYKTFSFGVGLERLQVNKIPIDLRYVSTALSPPPSTQWDPIASDLQSTVSSGTDYSVSHFYHPEYVGSRGYNYAGIFRAYVMSRLEFDPFVQYMIGFTHNRSSIYRSDDSRTISSSDKGLTWSIGAGGTYKLTSNLGLETYIGARNEHGFDAKDRIKNNSTGQDYPYTISVGQYYSFDFKLALKLSW
jgi:opacity protein-like surface antigen